MKFLEKIALVIYSNIILILSIVLCLLIFGWLDMNLIGNIIYKVIVGDVSSKILLGISVVFILLSIKCIFFDSTSKGKTNEEQGVLLENENGKLMISKETLENLVNSVALNFEVLNGKNLLIDIKKSHVHRRGLGKFFLRFWFF